MRGEEARGRAGRKRRPLIRKVGERGERLKDVVEPYTLSLPSREDV